MPSVTQPTAYSKGVKSPNPAPLSLSLCGKTLDVGSRVLNGPAGAENRRREDDSTARSIHRTTLLLAVNETESRRPAGSALARRDEDERALCFLPLTG